MITDTIKATGELDVVLYNSAGEIKDKREVKNLVVTIGKNHIADRLISNANVYVSHMAVGSGNVAASVSDNLLLGEKARVALDSATRANATVTYTATFPAGTGTGTLAEAGIFNNNTSNSGILLCRTRFNEVNKAADDIIVITWNVTIS